MDVKEIKEYMDMLAMYPSIELFEKEENGTRIMIRQQYHNCNNKGREQQMIKEQCELVEVKAPAVGKFYSIVLSKNKKELKTGELEKIITNGNNRIEIDPGLCVFDGQVLGTIVQLGFPFYVEAPCEGIIQSAFLSPEEQCQQQGHPVGFGEILFVIKKTC